MSIGFGAGADMKRSFENNKAQLKKRKSLKDIHTNYQEKKSDSQSDDNKMSPEAFEKFKTELREKRKKENRKRLMMISLFVLAGMIFLLWMIN